MVDLLQKGPRGRDVAQREVALRELDPGLEGFPWTEIEGRRYWDGGVADSTPLHPPGSGRPRRTP